MSKLISKFAATVSLSLSLSGAAHAFNPFTWSVNEIYSNAGGSVRFIVLSTATRGDPPPDGRTLIASNGTDTENARRHSRIFPTHQACCVPPG